MDLAFAIACTAGSFGIIFLLLATALWRHGGVFGLMAQISSAVMLLSAIVGVLLI